MNEIIIRTKIITPEYTKNLVVYIHSNDVENYKKYIDLEKVQERIKEILILNK